MNYLAHLYLSGQDEELIFGNFVADHIRGNTFNMFSENVKSGIRLHRLIDFYTDRHEIFMKTKKRLHKHYHKYSGVVADMYYDHFLAVNWNDYCSESLDDFSARMYDLMLSNDEILPNKTKEMMPHMIKENWLVNYQYIENMDVFFHGLAKRAAFESNMENAAEHLILYYFEMEEEFTAFFKEISEYVKSLDFVGKIEFPK